MMQHAEAIGKIERRIGDRQTTNVGEMKFQIRVGFEIAFGYVQSFGARIARNQLPAVRRH